jgi:hypothetical protein
LAQKIFWKNALSVPVSNANQMVMRPVSLENQLMPSSLEYTINKLVEKHIDFSVFDRRKTGLLSVFHDVSLCEKGSRSVAYHQRSTFAFFIIGATRCLV